MKAKWPGEPKQSPLPRFYSPKRASKEVLNAGTSEGPRPGAIVQSGVPLEFLRSEQEEEAIWTAQFEAGSQILGHLDRALQISRSNR